MKTKGDRMDERDVERGRTEWKKKGVGDRKKNNFFLEFGTVFLPARYTSS
jgi:hypothetical protein